MQLQQAAGNQLFTRMVRSHATTMAYPIQMRGENPHAQAGTLDGWELTAHHVIAHSQLLTAFARLNREEQAEILRLAIPDRITNAMTKNLKITIKEAGGSRDELTDEERAELRALLVSKASDDTEFHHIRIGDMRMSFFEWQGGNQFIGPNTSIRAEPSSSKDDLDTDGKYLSPLASSDFDKLTSLGGKLNDSAEEKNTLANLKSILEMTRNVEPNKMDASEWVEVNSIEQINRLVSDETFNRQHLLEYAYFKVGLNELGSGKKYDKISGASGDYFYEGKKIDFQVKGTNGYIQLHKAKTFTVENIQQFSLKQSLNDLGIMERVVDDHKVELTVDGEHLVKDGKSIRLTGFSEAIPIAKDRGEVVELSKKMFDNKKFTIKSETVSLFKYCETKGAPTSTFVPRKLYEQLET